MIARRVPLRRSAPLQRGMPPKRYVPVRKKRSRPTTRSGAKRRIPGMDSNPGMRRMLRDEWIDVIEAAHTNVLGTRGLGQKSSDFSAVPLCRVHHRDGPESYHRLGEQRFVERHRIELPQLVGSLNHLFLTASDELRLTKQKPCESKFV